ncbi:MAG: hypothetical protein JRJ85_11175, partial [Deltaproteobacteria bacterium]|nr:hypothetical protein [Deltaproteobacteria bacterium]
FNDPKSEVSRLLKGGGLVRVINTKVDTRPNIYYFNNTGPLNWPTDPELPTPDELRDLREEIRET